jgi:hypothetical protein
MAGIDPNMIEALLDARQEAGKGGGGGRGGQPGKQERRRDYREGLYAGDSRGPGGTGLDPQTEFDLAENNLAAKSHFAGLSGGNVGVMQSALGTRLTGNRRAAAAEAYNNRFRETEQKLKLLSDAEKLGYTLGPGGRIEKEQSGFEAGYTSPPASTPESGFNPQGAF